MLSPQNVCAQDPSICILQPGRPSIGCQKRVAKAFRVCLLYWHNFGFWSADYIKTASSLANNKLSKHFVAIEGCSHVLRLPPNYCLHVPEFGPACISWFSRKKFAEHNPSKHRHLEEVTNCSASKAETTFLQHIARIIGSSKWPFLACNMRVACPKAGREACLGGVEAAHCWGFSKKWCSCHENASYKSCSFWWSTRPYFVTNKMCFAYNVTLLQLYHDMLLCLCLRLMSYVPLHMEHCGKPFTINVPRSAFNPYISWKKTGKHFSIPPLGLSLDLVSTFVRSFSAFHQASALSRANGREQLLRRVCKLQELRVGVWSWHIDTLNCFFFRLFDCKEMRGA